jgi:hypothetical protein
MNLYARKDFLARLEQTAGIYAAKLGYATN